MTDRISIIALRTVSGVQIQIQQTDENGSGFGHRLAGGKHYNQPTTTLVERTLDADDAREIRSMLNAAFPPAPPLSDDERNFLSWALDLAAAEMQDGSLMPGVTKEDQAALDALRKLAGGEA